MRKTPIFAVAALLAAGCMTTARPLPGPAPGPGSGGTVEAPQPAPKVTITPKQQCQLSLSLARGAKLGILVAKIKDKGTLIALNSTAAGVEAGAREYCNAVANGEADALDALLTGFNAALDHLNDQLERAQLAQLSMIERPPTCRLAGVETKRLLLPIDEPEPPDTMIAFVRPD